jgi:hypothetical protein
MTELEQIAVLKQQVRAEEAVKRLEARLAHIKAVFRSQFT